MTLDEAIEHLERKYKEDDYSFEQPREWCFALQEWLEELREFRRGKVGELRDLTTEEEEVCYKALYNMSEDTGVRLF